MLRAIGNLLALVALVFITGMHFAILQSVASVRMVMDYSQGSSLSDGIEKTLSGEAPCAMCKKIRKAQSEDKKKSEAIGFSEKKSEVAILLTSTQISLRSFSNTSFGSFSEIASTRADEPALRPPRTV